MTRHLWLLLCLALTVAVGCSASRSTVTGPEATPLSASEVVRKVREAARVPHNALQLSADLSVRSPAFTGSVRALITHRRDDTLFASLTATALRVEAGRLWTTVDSFIYYDRFSQQVVYGSAEQLDQVMPGLFAGETAFETLLGLLVPDTDGVWTLDNAASQHILTDASSRYIIDPLHWRVLLHEKLRPDGTLLEAIRYTDFVDVDGQLYPRRVVLQHPEEGVVVSAYYREITLDPEMLNLDLQMPDNVPWVRAEDLMQSQ